MSGHVATMVTEPKISFVSFGRNDNYAPRNLERIQKSLDILVEQIEAFRLPAEIVFVEWNPPADAEPLSRAIVVPKRSSFASLRMISVPFAQHRRFRGSNQKGMHVAAAFNAGLRRARGKFVLPKVTDIFYTDGLISWMASGELDTSCIYRCDRYDVTGDVLNLEGGDRKSFLDACESRIVARHAAHKDRAAFRIADLHTNACGDFSLFSRDTWFAIRGWETGRSVACLDVDGLALHAAHAIGRKEVRLGEACKVYKIQHGAQTVTRISRTWKAWQRRLDNWVTNHGMSSDTQNRLRILLDYPRRTVAGLDGTFPSYERNFLRRARRWYRKRGVPVLNSAHWGCAGIELTESLMMRADWES